MAATYVISQKPHVSQKTVTVVEKGAKAPLCFGIIFIHN